jgi:hypothetical protein
MALVFFTYLIAYNRDYRAGIEASASKFAYYDREDL